jgi:Fe-S-cluster containining protein
MSYHGNICSFKCFGHDNYDGSCCHLEDRNWIIGPIEDYEKFLENLSNKIGRKVEFEEVFFSYEEGSKLFPEREVFQNPENFPSFRVDMEKPRKPCVMYNSATKSCSVYDIRPHTCRSYACDYLKEKLGVQK